MSGLDWVNSLEPRDANSEFFICLHSSRWAEAMSAARPFPSKARVIVESEKAFLALQRCDWREAFLYYPGPRDTFAMRDRNPDIWQWSKVEDTCLFDADKRTRAALIAGDREYKAKFGHAFIICSRRRSAASILKSLQERLNNDQEREHLIVVEEVRKIARLMLDKLLIGRR